MEKNLWVRSGGITTNSSESFNALLKRALKHEEVRLDELVLTAYFIQTFSLNEILRGRCGLGDWNLRDAKLREDVATTKFPKDVINPDNISDFV